MGLTHGPSHARPSIRRNSCWVLSNWAKPNAKYYFLCSVIYKILVKTQDALLLPVASETASMEQVLVTLFILITQQLVHAQLVVFILCSMMRKLLIIFITAFGRSSLNVSCSKVEGSFPWGNLEIELNAQCATYQL